MTITENDVYWITRCDVFAGVTTHIVVLLLIFAVIAWMGGLIWSIGEKESVRIVRKATVVAIVSILLSIVLCIGRIFIPTTKEMVAIKAIPVVANSKLVSKDAEVYIRRLLDIAIEKTEKKAGK